MERFRALVNDDVLKIENMLSASVLEENVVNSDVLDFLNNGSKRIRSVLSLLYLKSHNVLITDNIITLLAAGELIHNASLLHDDVIDEENTRRDNKTIYDKYGSKVSILCGDYLLSLAVEKLLTVGNSDIPNIFIESAKKMCNAEVVQYLNRNKKILPEAYISIICGKTATLFSSVLKSSALLCGLDATLAEKIGEIFGIIFQINNDLKPASTINDKKNGVYTAVDILGIEKTLALKDNYKKEMRELLSKIPNNEYRQGIEDLTDIL